MWSDAMGTYLKSPDSWISEISIGHSKRDYEVPPADDDLYVRTRTSIRTMFIAAFWR